MPSHADHEGHGGIQIANFKSFLEAKSLDKFLIWVCGKFPDEKKFNVVTHSDVMNDYCGKMFIKDHGTDFIDGADLDRKYLTELELEEKRKEEKRKERKERNEEEEDVPYSNRGSLVDNFTEPIHTVDNFNAQRPSRLDHKDMSEKFKKGELALAKQNVWDLQLKLLTGEKLQSEKDPIINARIPNIIMNG